MEEIDSACQDAVNGVPSRRPIMEMTIPSILDKTISPPGLQHIIVNLLVIFIYICTLQSSKYCRHLLTLLSFTEEKTIKLSIDMMKLWGKKSKRKKKEKTPSKYGYKTFPLDNKTPMLYFILKRKPGFSLLECSTLWKNVEFLREDRARKIKILKNEQSILLFLEYVTIPSISTYMKGGP